MKVTKEKIKHGLVVLVQFLLNPRFLICFGLAWMITNGWSYVLFTIGTILQIGWMVTVSAAYLAFLWLPISPEKIVTVAISIVLLRWLFPKDEKTLGMLRELYQKVKIKGRKTKKVYQRKRQEYAEHREEHREARKLHKLDKRKKNGSDDVDL